jgi:hypothetical protein
MRASDVEAAKERRQAQDAGEITARERPARGLRGALL